jgi:hypothetical protein
MWATEKKARPHECRKYENFTNVYLSPSDTLLNWIQEMLKTGETAGSMTGMFTDVFVSMHTSPVGLSKWNYERLYHGFSIGKVRWLRPTLAHLCNATTTVGGLDVALPDQDYIF